MSFKMKIYYLLINRVPGIRIKYNNYRKKNQGIQRVKAWGYLVFLNFRYYVLRQHDIGREFLNPDCNKKIVIGSESAHYRRETPEKLVSKLMPYDVISFDVFDTLVLRKMRLPEDVFYLIQRELHYVNLKNIRKEGELRARRKRYTEFGDYEVTLEEIWDEVEALTTINKKTGIECEFANEKKVCYANPYFLEVVKLLKEAGKKIIICSDMYLGSERIRELLKECGFPEIEHYYISCDYRKSKAKGNLFEVIKKELGSQTSYIHVGDNRQSDIVLAKRNGFHTYYYKNVQEIGGEYRAEDMSGIVSSIYAGLVNGHLHNGLKEWNASYEFGYIYGGLFVTGYCQFIHEFVKSKGIDKILFLSRDGDVLQKVYNKLFPEDKDKSVYVYWSRLAATKLCAHRFKSFYLERMISHKINQNYTVSNIFETMGIKFMLNEFVEFCHNDIHEECKFDSNVSELVRAFVETNWNRILAVYKDELEEGKRYFADVLGSATKAVAVDVGWVGSGALTLKQLIEMDWELGCTINGLVAGSCSGNSVDNEGTMIEFADGDITSYLFSDSDNRDVFKVHDASKGHNMIVELLLSSPKHSFRGFEKDENGNYQFNVQRESIDAEMVQKGILDFAEQYQKHPLHDIRISGRDAMAPIMLLYNNENYVKNLLDQSGIKANIE